MKRIYAALLFFILNLLVQTQTVYAFEIGGCSSGNLFLGPTPQFKY